MGERAPAPIPLPEEPYFWSDSEEAEYWNGPFASKALAIEEAKANGAEELIYIGTGREVDPADHFDSEMIFEIMGEEDGPVETTWAGYWRITREDFKELDRYLAEAFRSFARDKGLRAYYRINPEYVKVKL